MADKPHLSPRLFTFLRDLDANNDKAWFEANRERYHRDVRDPLVRFIADFAPRLRQVSPHFVADPRPVGGSLFRIHRDVRFSKDKRPYKTHAGVQFRHEAGKDAHAPGFYLHLEPGNVFFGAGLWHPDAKTLGRIRKTILENPAAWRRVSGGRTFKEDLRLAGESLKRAPKGVDPEHPMIGDLRRTDFVAVADATQKTATSAEFLDRYAGFCGMTRPFMRFLTLASGLPF